MNFNSLPKVALWIFTNQALLQYLQSQQNKIYYWGIQKLQKEACLILQLTHVCSIHSSMQVPIGAQQPSEPAQEQNYLIERLLNNSTSLKHKWHK